MPGLPSGSAWGPLGTPAEPPMPATVAAALSVLDIRETLSPWRPSSPSSRRSCSRLRPRCSSAGSSPSHVEAQRSRAWAGLCGCSPFRSGCSGPASCCWGTQRRGPRWIAAGWSSSSRCSSRRSSGRCRSLGVCAGLYFGLTAGFAKPVLNDLHVSVGEAVGDWLTWALLGFGFVAFLLQQLSLATGQLAPAMAAVSVANPAVSVLLGILLYEERLTRPGWHVAVAAVALLAALGGAVLITLANRETEMPDGSAPAAAPAGRVASG
jgi:hypothetical protein